MEKPAGVDPVDDIVQHGVPVLSPDADDLVAEIVALGGREDLESRYGLFYWTPPSFTHSLDSRVPLPGNFVEELRATRDRLVGERRRAGWEVDRLLEEAHQRRGR